MTHRFIATAVALSAAFASSAASAASITVVNTPISVGAAEYVLNPSRGDVAAVSAAQQGGAYGVNGSFGGSPYAGAATVASGSTAAPYFELSFTNDTGSEITGLEFAGTRIQFKDNSSNLLEKLTATVTGLAGVTASSFDINAVSNNGDSASTVSFLTAPYSVSLPSVSLAAGQSFTIRWTDANDGGTDAMFGIGNLSVTATTAIPEPTTTVLVGSLIAGAFMTARRNAARSRIATRDK